MEAEDLLKSLLAGTFGGVGGEFWVLGFIALKSFFFFFFFSEVYSVGFGL